MLLLGFACADGNDLPPPKLASKKRTVDLLVNKLEACLINAELGTQGASRNSMGQDVGQLLEEDFSNESISVLFEETSGLVIFPDTF